MQDDRSNLGRAARLLAHIERALGTQAKLAIDRYALAGANLSIHDLGGVARRRKATKDLRAHKENLGPGALTCLDQLTVVVVEPVVLAALAHQAGAYHNLHINPS